MPVILAGNGVIRKTRRGRAAQLRRDAAHRGGQHLHGQGSPALQPPARARRDRAEFTGPAVVRVRARRPDHLRRLRHGRVSARALEPRRRKDARSHQRTARRGRRALRRRMRRSGRHRHLARRDRGTRHAAGLGAVRGDSRGDPRRPCRTRERHRLPDQAAAHRVGVCAKRSTRTTSWSATSARTRCGCRATIAPSARTPASSPTVSPRWGSRCPERSRPSSPTPSARWSR